MKLWNYEVMTGLPGCEAASGVRYSVPNVLE